jgi:hypothetical protein
MKVGSVQYGQTIHSYDMGISIHSENGVPIGIVQGTLLLSQPHSQAILKEIESAVKRIVNKKRE